MESEWKEKAISQGKGRESKLNFPLNLSIPTSLNLCLTSIPLPLLHVPDFVCEIDLNSFSEEINFLIFLFDFGERQSFVRFHLCDEHHC